MPCCLEYQVAALARYPEAGLAQVGVRVFRDGVQTDWLHSPSPGEPPAVGLHDLFGDMLLSNRFCCIASAMRRESLTAAGGFREDLHYWEDYDLWLRIAAHAPVAMVEAGLMAIRKHGQNLSSSGMCEAQQAADHLHVLEHVVEHLPAARRTPEVLHQAARGRCLVEAELAAYEFCLGNRDSGRNRLLALLDRVAVAGDVALLTAAVCGVGNALDRDDGAYSASTSLLELLWQAPGRPVARPHVRRHLGLRHAWRAHRCAAQGPRGHAVAEALRAFSCSPTLSMARTVASVLRRSVWKGGPIPDA